MTATVRTGGCHCGALRFTVAVDLDAGSFRCNCSICAKSRAWLVTVQAADFVLQQGADQLTEYRFGPEVITHCFCRHCGVKTHGRVKGESGADDVVAVSIQCLDMTPEELDAVPRSCIDGLADRQDREPEITGYL
jgi:hypothetical protein